VSLRPNAGHVLLILLVSRSQTRTHHSRQDSSGRVISSSQRPLPDNTQHSQQTNIHVPGGIRTDNLSRRAAADLRLRSRGHWDRRSTYYVLLSLCILALVTRHSNRIFSAPIKLSSVACLVLPYLSTLPINGRFSEKGIKCRLCVLIFYTTFI